MVTNASLRVQKLKNLESYLQGQLQEKCIPSKRRARSPFFPPSCFIQIPSLADSAACTASWSCLFASPTHLSVLSRKTITSTPRSSPLPALRACLKLLRVTSKISHQKVITCRNVCVCIMCLSVCEVYKQ